MSTRYQGIALPWDGTISGLIEPKADINVLKSSIQWIILTRLGERVMRPEFGSSVPNVIGQPNSQATISELSSAIETAIKRWDTRIHFEKAEVVRDPAFPHQVLCRVFWKDQTDPLTETLEVFAFQVDPSGNVIT